MELSDGTPGQKALFTLAVLVYVLGLIVSLNDKLQRVGEPDVGWMMEGAYVSPTRREASYAGLRGGGRALRINGIEHQSDPFGRGMPAGVRTGIGETNTLTFRRPGGEVREVTLTVRAWEWKDVVFAEGAMAVIGALFFVVGVVSFALRPYEPASWALLALCSLGGGLLSTLLIPIGPQHALGSIYFLSLAGFIAFVPLHTALTFPVLHPLARRRGVLAIIYGLGFLLSAFYVGAWWLDWTLMQVARPWGAGLLLFTILVFVARCLQLAVYSRDRLVAQRARILLGGAAIGLIPAALVQFMQETFDTLAIDNRFLYWPMVIFVLALGRVTVRHHLLNARIAVRRAVLYGAAVGVLTLLAVLLVSVKPYAVAVLLLPLLYWWPRFDARLNARLYPKRARFPELVREIGEEMAASASVGDVMEVLAGAPGRLCDSTTSVAFLFPAAPGAALHPRTRGNVDLGHPATLVDEALIDLVRTTRKEIGRDQVAVEPQYDRIKGESFACLQRLSAEVLLPIRRAGRVVGVLAIGPRATGDVYEAAELDALYTVIHQAVSAIGGVEATERLRARELEFADLKRFLSPQIIDQVMARGGAAELRSQRKLVTVFFADIRGFTSFSDSVEPEEVMATLAEYHGAMGRRIAEFAGTLERFAGDGFMVFFNDPVDQSDHVERACRMSLAMRDDIERLRREWQRKGYPIHVGIGIHTGYATCGFLGYEGRRDYGVIGNVTNLAARLSDAAGPGEILVSARVEGELRNGFRTEPAGTLELKGFHQPQAAFRLLALD